MDMTATTSSKELTPEQKKANRAFKEAIRKRRKRFQDLSPDERLAYVVNRVLDAHRRDISGPKINHDQGIWLKATGDNHVVGDTFDVTCNTAGCVAGHTVAMYGDTAVIGDLTEIKEIASGAQLNRKHYAYIIESCIPWEKRHLTPNKSGFYPANAYEDIAIRAKDLLGLTMIESAILFQAHNTPEEIRAIALEILTDRKQLKKAFISHLSRNNVVLADLNAVGDDRARWTEYFNSAERFLKSYSSNFRYKTTRQVLLEKHGTSLTRISARL
ncbi:hypothetical protein SEA_SIXAMA_50 [Gordonia phage Sixama]|uniref:Uncharacterized protein n=1 Tax=Gordonia phage Sixama TaxID=2653271 RepID=A0A5Q2F130_9CAUD|nr:hypothetical protein PP302_gp050 [Gordonia phage Sixama]QGF20229.1 hypothetical protein SEA_SIXAMA_50 [Gordonia phage Sixama]